MEQASVNGITLEYEEKGSGEPVVFIHGALIANTFEPLMAEPALNGFRLIRYHRRGHATSTQGEGPLPVSIHSADCLALLRHLTATPAHVVGHSGGGVIALQLVRDAPEAVRSLTLMEPALLDVPSGTQLLTKAMGIVQMYQSGDRSGAVHEFLRSVCGETYRERVEAAIPGALEQAAKDADTFFGRELPALTGWTFTQRDAAGIKRPVLSVLGAASEAVWPGYGEIHARVLDWFPDTKPFVLPGATHLLQVENPRDMAAALSSFLQAASD